MAVLPTAEPDTAGSDGPPSGEFCSAAEPERVLRADPSTYRRRLAELIAGDTLLLEPGVYPRLAIAGVNGAAGRCITISGPAGSRPAMIFGESGRKTVEVTGSSYLVLRNLVIDSRGLPGADGIKADGKIPSAAHHIVIENNLIIGAGATQQTDGISTKTPAWNWVIRNNTIVAAGTGIYLGDSDGTAPFIAGLIEGNLVVDPTGYAMQIKYQRDRPLLPGMPAGPRATIIRNNVFQKDDRPSPDGDRPNLLVGGFPDQGPGSRDVYRIYGNLLVGNPREALFQGSGRIVFHDNLLIGGVPAAAIFRDHDLPLKLAEVFDNTIHAPHIGIRFESRARERDVVFGNTIFAETPVSGIDDSTPTGGAAAGADGIPVSGAVDRDSGAESAGSVDMQRAGRGRGERAAAANNPRPEQAPRGP